MTPRTLRDATSAELLRHSALISFAVLTALLAGGCQESGPPRYHVSGTVSYEGKPVPHGSIIFQPDESAGNSGPYGNAAIRDGLYDTRVQGTPPVGGPQIVIIEGFDGENITDYTPYGQSLGLGYMEKRALPKEETVLHFELTERGK